jgi:hypothetical protein
VFFDQCPSQQRDHGVGVIMESAQILASRKYCTWHDGDSS